MMITEILGILGGITVAGILRYVIKQLLIMSVKAIADPLVKQFFRHIRHWAYKEGHPELNALECPDCDHALRNLPH